MLRAKHRILKKTSKFYSILCLKMYKAEFLRVLTLKQTQYQPASLYQGVFLYIYVWL